jgi:hypothetical protein
MKVVVGNRIYSSEDQPVGVILTEKNIKDIAGMDPELTTYCEYPQGMSRENMQLHIDYIKKEEECESTLSIL